MYKIYLLLFIFSQLIANYIYCQTGDIAAINTENGYTLPCNGQVRLFLIFAELDCNDCEKTYFCHPDDNNWPAGELPKDADLYFDHFYEPGQSPVNHITKYYYEASLGNYILLGDYFPEIVTIPCKQLKGNGTNQVIQKLNTRVEPITSANINPETGKHYTLNDFDSWGNEGVGVKKSNKPNGIIDGIVIIWRNNRKISKACHGGYGMAQILGNRPLQDKKVLIGSTFNSCGSGSGGMGMVLGEYFHAVFGGNNWHTSSGASYHTFLSYVGSFSITGQGRSSGVIACGWDRYHLGWKHPEKKYLISAQDPFSKEVNTEMVTIENTPGGGTYILRDFYTSGDAIRIKLPHINWERNGDVKNQYLWLENHQMLSEYDHSLWNENKCKEDWVPGLYAYIQVGKDIKTGNKKNVFPSYSSSDWEKPNGLASWLFPLSAEGRYDFKYRFDLEQKPDPSLCCNWGNSNIPKDKNSPFTLENPFTGFSDLFEALDYDNNGILFNGIDHTNKGDFKVLLGLSEVINGQVIHNCNSRGDSKDAFRMSANSEISISTNPAPVPVYTYRSGIDLKRPNKQHPASFENRTIWLNGLYVKIIKENINNGAIMIIVEWDYYTITEDVRWCGNIVLQNNINDPFKRKSHLKLMSKKKITLDRGLSATSHVGIPLEDGSFLFSDTTQLILKDSTSLLLSAGSELILLNNSKLIIEKGAELIMEEKSGLIFSDVNQIIFKGGVIRIPAKKGDIVLPEIKNNDVNMFESVRIKDFIKCK